MIDITYEAQIEARYKKVCEELHATIDVLEQTRRERDSYASKLDEVRTAVREYLEAMYSNDGAHPDLQKRVHNLCGVKINR